MRLQSDVVPNLHLQAIKAATVPAEAEVDAEAEEEEGTAANDDEVPAVEGGEMPDEAKECAVDEGVTLDGGDALVRQRRHHFCPFPRISIPPYTRRLLSGHPYRVLIDACNPMFCPMHVFRME